MGLNQFSECSISFAMLSPLQVQFDPLQYESLLFEHRAVLNPSFRIRCVQLADCKGKGFGITMRCFPGPEGGLYISSVQPLESGMERVVHVGDRVLCINSNDTTSISAGNV